MRIPTGSDWMLRLLMNPTPEAFVSFAEDYYEQAVDLDAVRHVFEGQPLTRETVVSLNPDGSFAEISQEAKLMGFAIAPAAEPS